jgi:hypothetical protein
MAADKLSKTVKFPHVHKMLAGISLLIFTVTMIAGMRADARFITITVRALVAMVIVALIGRVVVRLIASYEEIHGGKN